MSMLTATKTAKPKSAATTAAMNVMRMQTAKTSWSSATPVIRSVGPSARLGKSVPTTRRAFLANASQSLSVPKPNF